MLGKILAVASLALIAGGLGAPPAFAEECSQAARTSGECPTISSEVTSQGVTLGASSTTSGSSGSSTSSAPSAQQSPSSPRASLPWSPPPPRSPVIGTSECSVVVQGRCRGSSPAKNPPPAATPPASTSIAPTPPSSVNDLAHFTPSPSSIQVEPGWWTLPRLHTNIFSTAREHQVAGELLGVPIDVRFSPRSYRWTYGDNQAATISTAGASWGSDQFSPTATSHIYREPGTYSIRLVVDYAVSYRYVGTGFTPVSGTVSQSVGPATVSVLRVTPVLVDQGCFVNTLREGRCEGNQRVFLGVD
jgi:hypothetical protein